MNVQGLIQGITPSEIYSENFDSEIMDSEQESASGPPCKKGRMLSKMEKAFFAANKN